MNPATPGWVFAKITGAAVRRDPNETELFKTSDAGENEYAGTDALVREVIQNSMDARSGDGPVRIRFALHSYDKLPPADRLAAYFSRLKPALEFREIGFDLLGRPDLKLGFLVCEDFGTRGLCGDVMRATDPPTGHDKREDFFWFWRNIGRSGKTEDDLGRWGLGKTVYRAASRVGCMLGLTVRQEDRRRLVMGQAVLRLHRHEGIEYAPEGFWCSCCDNESVPMPIDSKEELDQFTNEWLLTRRDEPGLSVVVPYVAEGLRASNILQLIAVNFFVPIIQGKLIVDVHGDELGENGKAIRVDSDSIESVCKELKWMGKSSQKQNAQPPIELTRRSLEIRQSAVPTCLLGTSAVPVIDQNTFEGSTLCDLRHQLASDEVVPICVRLSLPRRDGGADEGELLVFLHRFGGTDRRESYFVREGMTITRLNSKRSLRGTAALVLVEPGHLASLLGDTEGPSHISWDTSNDERPNRTWKTWKGRVSFCCRIVDSLVELLSPPPDEADFELLSDFFSIDQVSAAKPNRKPGDKGTNSDGFIRPEPKPRWYRISRKVGGFRITNSPDLPIPENMALRISVAYDMAGGNPLRHWNKLDFDLRQKDGQPIRFKGKNLAANARDGNVVEVVVKDSPFELTASGFDIHRDLFIRVDEVASEGTSS